MGAALFGYTSYIGISPAPLQRGDIEVIYLGLKCIFTSRFKEVHLIMDQNIHLANVCSFAVVLLDFEYFFLLFFIHYFKSTFAALSLLLKAELLLVLLLLEVLFH